MIWTKEEEEKRQFENMLKPEGKFCHNCHWGACRGNEFVTCGTHVMNFQRDSMCEYWTDPNDRKLQKYILRKQNELLQKYIK